MKLSTHCSWANLRATWSLEVCSERWGTLPQHPLTPLRHFTWPTTWWLSCSSSDRFHFITIPLTVDCGILRSEKVSQLDLLHRWHPITVPRWHSMSSWERPILSQTFVETVCMPRCLLLYTCGRGSDWNTWFQLLFNGWLNTFGNIVYVRRISKLILWGTSMSPTHFKVIKIVVETVHQQNENGRIMSNIWIHAPVIMDACATL